MKRLFLTFTAIGTLGFCQCAHQETSLESEPIGKPEYQPPHMPIATALNDEAEEARRDQVHRDEASSSISSAILSGLVDVAFAAIFGTREERWRKSRKRKILVKKGYIDKDDGPPPEDFPSQF